MDLNLLLTSSLIATIAAFALNQGMAGYRRLREASARLHGILLEIDYAERCALEYLDKSKPRSPAYRVATEFLSANLPWLTAEHYLSRNEARAVHELYLWAGDSNRSLDAFTYGTAPKWDDAGLRNLARTMQVSTKLKHVRDAVPTARAAVLAALSRIEWRVPAE